jgi:hypothetical protein
VPNKERVEPKRAKDLNDIEDAKWTLSSTDKDAPRRAKLRNDKLAPK